MPRPLRVHIPGGIYHVTLRGNHRQAIFTHDGERTLLKTILARSIDKHAARVHAYCWMSNHVHLVMQVGETPLGRVIQQVASEYARAFQQNIATTGHLFENRHHATLIDTDTYFLEALRYVHRNPVAAGIVDRAGHYRWSSHAAYVRGGEPWVTTDFGLALFSPSPSRARALYRAFVDEEPAAAVAAELAALEDGAATLGGSAPPKTSTAAVEQPAVEGTLADVIRSGCEHFAIAPAELLSASRRTRVVAARQWIIRTAMRGGLATVPELARALGRDESTVRHALAGDAGETSEVIPVIPVIPL